MECSKILKINRSRELDENIERCIVKFHSTEDPNAKINKGNRRLDNSHPRRFCPAAVGFVLTIGELQRKFLKPCRLIFRGGS